MIPAPIEIPSGYLYLLSSDDLEDDAVITEKYTIGQNKKSHMLSAGTGMTY